MTSTLERSARSPQAGLLGPALAQVNLLPPEIRASRALGRVKRGLAFGLVAVLVLAALGYAAAVLRVGSARDQLAIAEADGAQLTEDQQQYAEVPVVLGQLASLDGAREQGFSTEITWKPYLGAILAVMPAGVSLSSIDIVGATPMLASAVPTDPLQAPSVTRIAFAGRSATVPDTGGWIDALNSIPGFSDAWVASVTVAEDESSGVYYSVSSSVQVTDLAYADRFGPEEGS